MKRILYIIVLLIFFGFGVQAQNSFTEVLQNIEANNTTLRAYREQANADKIGNKTAANLANPEVEFGYLWGSPADEGKRIDLGITQSFDFPTAYRYRSQLIDGQNRQVDLAYNQQRREVLHEARLICIELAYLNKKNKQLEERVIKARELSNAYQKSFDRGEIDVLERNKAKLDLINIEKELQMNEVGINLQKAELQRMNGDQPISIDINEYSGYRLTRDFAEWFSSMKENIPSLQIAEQEIVISRKQEQLTKALNLPKISAGYTSERVGGVTFQGVALGVSIPLWEGKNTVKHQKAQTIALQMQYDDARVQLQNTLKSQYDKANKLFVLLKEYQETLKVTNDYALLKTALDKGQLSLINYLLELSVYYDTIDTYFETERDYQLAVAELQRWE